MCQRPSKSAYIPPHLACSKGIVRGVDAQLSPAETLEKLSVAGVVAVYRCNRVVDNKRVPTESVIATFAGTSCPSEIKAWPLIIRVDQLASRPLQCRNCWRFGHSAGGCKSDGRCCRCGDAHSNRECTAQEDMCCLCGGQYAADNADCPIRQHEMQVLEIIDKRRCSRREAIATVKERLHGYAGVTARQMYTDTSLAQAVEIGVDKAMAKLMDQIAISITECIAQAVSNQIAKLLTPAPTGTPESPQMLNASEDNILCNDKENAAETICGSPACH